MEGTCIVLLTGEWTLYCIVAKNMIVLQKLASVVAAHAVKVETSEWYNPTTLVYYLNAFLVQ